MSQVTDFVTPGSPLTMSALKTFLDACFAAVASANRGATAPDNPFEGMLFWDTSGTPTEVLKRYTAAAGWIPMLSINITTGAYRLPILNSPKINEDVAVTATATEINELAGATLAVGDVTATAAEVNAAAGGIGVTIPKVKIVEIGDWNMDTTETLNVAHGLTYANIRGVSAIIRNDEDNAMYDFMRSINIAGAFSHYIAVNTTNISLNRANAGAFDNTSFDATSYNRGWVTIWYVD